MKHNIHKDRIVCIKQLRNRLEAIQKLQPPTTVKGCRRFAGMVNFLIMFCPELKKWIKPIYDLSRKGRQFIWGSKFATGSTLYQIQNEKPKLIAYASKRLLEAARNHSRNIRVVWFSY